MSTSGVGGRRAGDRTILDCLMHKLPSSRKHYHVRLVVPDSGIPFIEYRQISNFVKTKKTTKTIQFVDLLFADKKHDESEKFAFSIYSIDKTVTFLPHDETVMNEWLAKIRELHSMLYPESKRYDSIFEARLLDRGLATTMHIQGQYRLAVCKESLDLIPILTPHDQQQSNNNVRSSSGSATSASLSTTASTISSTNSHPHHHHQMETNLPNTSTNSYLQNQHPHSSNLDSTLLNQPQPTSHHHHHHHHLPQHPPNHKRFSKRHPHLASRTIELVLRSIRRCGHTQANFYIESGRHSQIGEGDLWMALDKKSTARQLHELLLATMKLASTNDDQFLFRAPRSRSGSSSDNAHRSQQSRSSSLVCLNADTISPAPMTTSSTPATSPLTACNNTIPVNVSINILSTQQQPNTTSPTSMLSNNYGNSNSNSNGNGKGISNGNGKGSTNLNGNFLSNLFGNHQSHHHQFGSAAGTAAGMSQASAVNSISTLPMFPNHDNNNIEEDSGYLPMA